MSGRWLCRRGWHRWLTLRVTPHRDVLGGHGGRVHDVVERCSRCGLGHRYSRLGAPRRVRA